MRIWFSLLLVGCASSYGPEDYMHELGAAHCQRMLDCCTDAEYQDWWTPDSGSNTQRCTDVWENPPHGPKILDAIQRGTIHFDAKAAHACVQALQTLDCSQFEPGYRFRETYCESPFVGTVQTGQPCQVDEECTSRSCDLPDPNANPIGVCRDRVDIGQSCAFTGGNACQVEDSCAGMTCEAGLAAGAACGNDAECADDWCKGASMGAGYCLRACDGR